MEYSNFESTRELYDVWLKTYNSTFGRFVEMPVLGPTREKTDSIMKGFSNFANFLAIWLDFSSDFQKLFIESMQQVNEKIETGTNRVPGPERFKDYYNIWIETYSDTYKDFMRSDHFSSDMGKLMSYFMELQKYNREILEDNYLKQMNLPTKTDVDEINRELYSLRKKQKEFSQRPLDTPTKAEFDKLAGDINSLKKAVEESGKKPDDVTTKEEFDKLAGDLTSLRRTVEESGKKPDDVATKEEFDKLAGDLVSLKKTVKGSNKKPGGAPTKAEFDELTRELTFFKAKIEELTAQIENLSGR